MCGYNRAFAPEDDMRITLTILSIFMLSGCTALMVGGAAAVGYQVGKDERTAGVVASDSAITTKIKGKYTADSVVSVFNVGVRTYEGTVTLTGTVGSYIARDQAALLAKETSGVVAVNNQIVVEDQSK
jgi:hyperosmotically inducible protein